MVPGLILDSFKLKPNDLACNVPALWVCVYMYVQNYDLSSLVWYARLCVSVDVFTLACVDASVCFM